MASSGELTFDEASSSTGSKQHGDGLILSDDIPPPGSQFVVTKFESQVYYKGLPSQPPLIATTIPGPIEVPTGMEAYSILKQLRCIGDHPLALVWDAGLALELRHALNTMGLDWTSLDLVRIGKVGEHSCPAIVWIGVKPGTLTFERGSEVAINCQKLVNNSVGVGSHYVEIRESCVMRYAGNRFLDPVPFSHPTFTARNPYTATLGIPISPKQRPRYEGTGGLFLSAGGDDKNLYFMTARHVILPDYNNDNEEYYHQNNCKRSEEVLLLGDEASTGSVSAILYEIREQRCEALAARKRIALVQDLNDGQSVRECEEAEKDHDKALKGIGELQALHREINTHWMENERRVFGELIWAPPITFSTEPNQYTLDLAIIKIHAGKLDTKNYRGNTINIGKKYSPLEFTEKVYLDSACLSSLEFPPDRLVRLQGQVPESALFKPPVPGSDRGQYLVVFKNGATSGTTIGKANNVSSYTRHPCVNTCYESREWPVISIDEGSASGPFSTRGDSGSCIADAYNRVGGILTGGTGSTSASDITYVTPISFIMNVLHGTKLFENAHLNPALV